MDYTIRYGLEFNPFLKNSKEIFVSLVTFIYSHLLKFSPSHYVCNHNGTMTSADFSPFVVTDGFHTLFPTADETSLGTTRHFLSIYLPHLLLLIPSSYWTLVCRATLSLTVA